MTPAERAEAFMADLMKLYEKHQLLSFPKEEGGPEVATFNISNQGFTTYVKWPYKLNMSQDELDHMRDRIERRHDNE